ncbi:MAG: YcxB family protein [Acidobacteriota bacterium]|nr:YcxB family protein [Acidobacteriota bacterium]
MSYSENPEAAARFFRRFLTMEQENQTLHLDYEVSLDIYRQIWLDLFKPQLPEILAFWGTAILLGFLGAIFLLESYSVRMIAFTVLGFLIIFMIYSIYSSYRQFMDMAKKIYRELDESHKSVSLIFNSGSDGFESINGKNFSHTSWDSVKSVDEKNRYFIFQLAAGTMFYIPKTAFGNETRLDFFRSMLKSNLGDKTKLLNE